MGALTDSLDRPRAAQSAAAAPAESASARTGELIPVLPALQSLVPGGGLRPGQVVTLAGSGASSLGLALVAGAGREGGWSAVVGIPEFGVVAAAGMGADPGRLLLVDSPGPRWADVVAALAEAVELVLVRPPGRPAPAVTRRLLALTRKHHCALAVAGPWEGAHLRLQVESAQWLGAADGTGRLLARRALVSATGRGAIAAGRETWLWLPTPTGAVTLATPARPTRPHLEVVA